MKWLSLKNTTLRLHYTTKHKDRYKDLNTQQKHHKVQELKRNLVSQQTKFKKAKSQSDAAVKARFIVTQEIAKSAIHLQRES